MISLHGIAGYCKLRQRLCLMDLPGKQFSVLRKIYCAFSMNEAIFKKYPHIYFSKDTKQNMKAWPLI